MSYFLFILVTATLFVRPAEIMPAVYGWPIYEVLILACLAVSLEGVLAQLSLKSLQENPITACVIGLWAAIVLSHLAHFRTWEARMAGFDFFKIVVYYLLLVANVNSEARLKSFLRWLLLFITLIAALALLGAHHIIELPGVDFIAEKVYDKTTGEMVDIPRLCSTGIFKDPNDLAMILVPGVVAALYFAAAPAGGILRPLLLPLIGLFGYAIYATQSRGGLLALMGAVLVLSHARWGLKRTALVAALVLPALLLVFKGRMTSYDDAMGGGSGQSRVELWSAGMQMFKQHPVFGIGYGTYADEAGQVAHNSFVHAFVELGFFGGALFLGAFVAPLIMLYRLREGEGIRDWGLGEGNTSPLADGRGAGGEGGEEGMRDEGLGISAGVSSPLAFGRGAGGEGGGKAEPSTPRAPREGNITRSVMSTTEDDSDDKLPPDLARLLPYLTAMLVGFAVSMFSLSRNYSTPVYLMLGLATAYGQIAGAPARPRPLRFDAWFLKRIAISSVGFLAFIYVFIRVGFR